MFNYPDKASNSLQNIQLPRQLPITITPLLLKITQLVRNWHWETAIFWTGPHAPIRLILYLTESGSHPLNNCIFHMSALLTKFAKEAGWSSTKFYRNTHIQIVNTLTSNNPIVMLQTTNATPISYCPVFHVIKNLTKFWLPQMRIYRFGYNIISSNIISLLIASENITPQILLFVFNSPTNLYNTRLVIRI